VPSQNGDVAVRLQPHSHFHSLRAIVNLLGVKPLPAWEPSQNGWFFERPHAHQK
jgi:hypothetical protein